jgi:peptide/nickel transport system substrate-binding protein
MRRALALTAALVACALPACTKTDVAANAGGATRHPWTLPGHLRYGTTEEPDSLNKLLANSDASDQIANLIFAPVFRFDDRGALYPELATEVPSLANGGIARDGKTLTLHLRKGVVWSDGAPLDGRDIVFTWHAVMNPATNTRLRTGWDDIASMSLPDPYTVVVRLKAVDAAIVAEIFGGGGGSAYPPLPAHLLAKEPNLNRVAFNSAPIASGPFVLKKWNRASSLELVANPRYFRGKPKLDAISWIIIPNSDTLFNALKTHDVDVVDPVTDNQIDAAKALPNVATSTHLISNLRHLEINTRRPYLADVRVRRAIAEAVDWDRINRVTYHGTNERATSDIFPTTWAAPKIPFFPHDVADAKRLLTAAGWIPGPNGVRTKDGARLAVSVSTGTNKPANINAEVQMQQMLAAVGIALEIKNYPVSLLFAQNGPLYTGNYDMSWTIDTGGPDPDNEGVWSGIAIPPHGANTSFLDDPEITRLAHEGKQTFDLAKRKALYQREEERIHATVPAVFLYWARTTAAYNDDFKNYRPAPYIAATWNSWQWEI